MSSETVSAAALLAELYDRDAMVSVTADSLRIKAPDGVLTPDRCASLRTHKAELLSLITRAEEYRLLLRRAFAAGLGDGDVAAADITALVAERWFTFNWPAHWHVIWTVVPTSPRPGGPQIRFNVEVERASDRYITYWILITNLTNVPVNIEARYAVLGW